MVRNYKIRHRLIALLLLISFLLESCYNNTNIPLQLQPSNGEEKINLHQELEGNYSPAKIEGEEISSFKVISSTQPREKSFHIRANKRINRVIEAQVEEAQEIEITHSKEEDKRVMLADKKFITQGRHSMSLYQESGLLRARVKENLPASFSKKHKNLPVYLAVGISISDVASLNEGDQQRFIEVKLPNNNQPGYVYVGKRGLLGGMKKGSKGNNEEKVKEDKAATRESPTSLGDFIVLPKELLQIIFTYIKYPYILDCIKVNHTFYELITGYAQGGMLGLSHKPNSLSYATIWASNKLIDFSKDEFNKLTPETIPSFSFYRLIGEVENLPQSFWPHLQDTNIVILNLRGNNLDTEVASKLALALSNTNIHTLDLSDNQIGDGGASKLAEALPTTNIHILDVSILFVNENLEN